MTIELSIYRDLSANSRRPTAYTVGISESTEPSRPLRQTGPVWNNIVSYRGVFDDRRAAVEAALDYITTPCSLIARTDVLSGRTAIVVSGLTLRQYPGPGYSHRVLGSNLPTGRYLAAEG